MKSTPKGEIDNQRNHVSNLLDKYRKKKTNSFTSQIKEYEKLLNEIR